MIPRKLVLRNFMCYRDDVPPLDLDGISIACLSGENGSGKSALLDAITWALWGEARLKSDDELIALGAQEMEVELIFALDGQDYRIIRKRSKGRKTGQSALDFQVRNNGSWKVLSGAGIRETQQTILSTLRMDYDIFANSAYLRQGHADEFTRKEPGRRKQVLADILGLDAFEELEGKAKERAKELDGQLKVLEGQIGELERQAEKRAGLTQLVDEAEARVDELAHAVGLAEAALAEASERVQMLESRKPLRDELQARLGGLRAERDELVREIDSLRGALAEAEQMLARRADIATGVAALKAAQAELERLDGLSGEYEALQKRRSAHDDTLRDAERRLRADLRVAEGELKGCRERAARRPAIEAEITRLAAKLAGFATLSDELAAARGQRGALRERDQVVHKLQLQLKDLQKQIDLRHDSLVGTREELKRRIKDATARLKDEALWRADLDQANEERARREDDLAHLEELRRIEHESVEQVGALRAACDSIKAQGDEINKKLALLGSDAQACPLCGSELGHDGIAHIEAEYERERKDLRAQFSAARREADAIEAQLKQQRAEIKTRESRAAELPQVAARIARLEGDLLAAEESRRGQVEDQRALDDVQLQLVKGDYQRGVRAEIAQVEAEIAGLGSPAALDREVRALDARIATLESGIAEQAHLKAQIDALHRDLRAIDDEAPALHELDERIAELTTTLQIEDYAREERVALARLDGELAALGYTPDQHRTTRAEARALAGWADEEQRLQRAEERVERDGRELARDEDLLCRRSAEIESVGAQLDALEQELRALAPAARERDAAADALKVHRRELLVRERDLGEKRADLKRAEDAAADLLAYAARREALIGRKSLFDELTHAFGKKGVQALLIETAIPEIEREANALLARMTDNQMHLSFETQRDTKKGDVSETLEIKIADGLGTRDYDAFSGGESFRLNFAIRIALAKLLAKRAGARLETLVIDEGFGTQDTRGRERLVEAITSVQSEFKQILVVTHIQELKDMFPVQIEITKTPQGSVWAIG
ncbi:MAG TPA: SMC family ATPase [Roseiflexaceae bacterium]